MSKIREIFRFQEDKSKNEIVFLYDLIFQKYYLKMILKEFTSELDKLFSLKQAEDFDNVGLLCGNPAREVSGVLVCHDALESVVDEAIAKKCNLIVCFHPIIFSGMKKITGKKPFSHIFSNFSLTDDSLLVLSGKLVLLFNFAVKFFVWIR